MSDTEVAEFLAAAQIPLSAGSSRARQDDVRASR